MKRLLFLTFFTISLFHPVFGQIEVPVHDKETPVFNAWDAKLNEVKAQENYQDLKGWKYLAREIEFYRSRRNPGGAAPDFAAFNKLVVEHQHQEKYRTGSGWTPIGPFYPATFDNLMGRINCIEFHPTDSNTFWVGVAQGGIWKTTNGGQNWTPLDQGLPILRISDIEVDPNNTDVLYASIGDMAYAGTGLYLDGRKRHTHYGLGVYKTTDGGLNWFPTNLSFQQNDWDYSLTRRVFVHPNHSDSLVAAGFHGVWTSSDGGQSWTQTQDTLVWDIEMDPQNPNILYASLAHLPTLNAGGAGIMKSVDFGQTWLMVSSPIPPYLVNRVELAISPSNPNVLYALASNLGNGLNGVYTSTDGGISWALKYNSLNLLHWYGGQGAGGQGFYDLTLAVDPLDPQKVYVGGVNLWGSNDGGNTFNPITYWADLYNNKSIHADLHQLKINPLDGKAYLCNDGGMVRTNQLVSQTWTTYNSTQTWPTVWEDLSGGMNTTSFYRLGVYQSRLEHLIAGAQDNSTVMSQGGTWSFVSGGDGMECFFHPNDPSITFSSSQYGSTSSNTYSGLNPPGNNPAWTTPFMLSPVNSNIFMVGYSELFVTALGSQNWSQQTNINLGTPISHFSVSADAGQMYLSTRPDYLSGINASFWTNNPGGIWNAMSGLPDSLFPTYSAVSQLDGDIAYFVFGGFSDGNKVFGTTDGGLSWANLSKDLPNVPVNCIVHETGHPNNRIFIGTDLGVYYTDDTTSSWMPFNEDLPAVIVGDLEINYMTGRLVSATFGRGIWEADLPQEINTSVDDGFGDFSWQVEPNPWRDQALLKLEGSGFNHDGIHMVDVFGRVVAHWPKGRILDTDYVEMPSQIPPGVYFLRIQKGNISRTLKLIKQ